MIETTPPKPLRRQVFAALLLAMFVIAVGYGFLLPILPSIMGQTMAMADSSELPRHTGLLTGLYTIAIFLFAPLWGQIADRRGRRPVLLVGLIGFAVTLALFAVVDSLPLLYLGRFANGVFSSAIPPAAYALVSDHAPSKEWRARRLALLSIAGAVGFLVGPMLGSLTLLVARELVLGVGEAAAIRLPFFATSGVALLGALAIWLRVPDAVPRKIRTETATNPRVERAAMVRLLVVSFVTALAVGAFEVGLSLRATRILGMSLYQIGVMFTECSLVMLVVQAIVFSPLVKPETTRWLLMPSLVLLAVGLAAVPLATTTVTIALAIALVAASAGILAPIATYWISLGADEKQGAALGRQIAATSLGQTVGSIAGGLLFSATFLPNAPFSVAAVIVIASLVASFGLPDLLMRTVLPRNPERP